MTYKTGLLEKAINFTLPSGEVNTLHEGSIVEFSSDGANTLIKINEHVNKFDLPAFKFLKESENHNSEEWGGQYVVNNTKTGDKHIHGINYAGNQHTPVKLKRTMKGTGILKHTTDAHDAYGKTKTYKAGDTVEFHHYLEEPHNGNNHQRGMQTFIKHPHEEGSSRVVGGKDMHPVNFIKYPHLHTHRLTDTSD